MIEWNDGIEFVSLGLSLLDAQTTSLSKNSVQQAKCKRFHRRCLCCCGGNWDHVVSLGPVLGKMEHSKLNLLKNSNPSFHDSTFHVLEILFSHVFC